MNKCVIIPDSFKGTLSSIEVCRIISQSVRKIYDGCDTVAFPVADGGEGTVDCFLNAIDCRRVDVSVSGPYGEPCGAYYARRGDTAIIEMAMCAGLPQVEGRANPELTTTYGVGQVIALAMEAGCREILLGLGGSCTTDAGAGMAEALGIRFLDTSGAPVRPTGGTLGLVGRIDASGVHPLLKDCAITAMCDIDNPMFGKRGAAYVFGPQKGADAAMVERLDAGLIHISEVIKRDLGMDVSELPGAGAAGAMGAGVVAFLGGKLKSGITAVLDMVGFDAALSGAGMVITGEGRIDSQSLRGKVVIGVAERAKAAGVPVVAMVGSVGEGAEGAYERGVSAIFSINRAPEPFETARLKSADNLRAAAEDMLRLWKAAGK